VVKIFTLQDDFKAHFLTWYKTKLESILTNFFEHSISHIFVVIHKHILNNTWKIKKIYNNLINNIFT